MTNTTTTEQGHKGRGSLSVDDDSLEDMVQQASVPSLASLFQQAKDQGLIGPVTVYGGANGGA